MRLKPMQLTETALWGASLEAEYSSIMASGDNVRFLIVNTRNATKYVVNNNQVGDTWDFEKFEDALTRFNEETLKNYYANKN